ncbi:uncharacterized protein LOC122878304 [Siniperca chuatsi]|uniref:uncharacterized protein LOC122878304 n=1 Tax=Siniperca chuatsi TaxID=119488 RepID=UPI001CE1BADF|nr:uncharacterized protein LOC122878304 [Siniperca chuatsi]
MVLASEAAGNTWPLLSAIYDRSFELKRFLLISSCDPDEQGQNMRPLEDTKPLFPGPVSPWMWRSTSTGSRLLCSHRPDSQPPITPLSQHTCLQSAHRLQCIYPGCSSSRRQIVVSTLVVVTSRPALVHAETLCLFAPCLLLYPLTCVSLFLRITDHLPALRLLLPACQPRSSQPRHLHRQYLHCRCACSGSQTPANTLTLLPFSR